MVLYLDPGSGAMIVQALVAGVAGVIVFFKYQGRRIKSFFGGKEAEPKTTDEHDEAPPKP